MTSSTPAGKDFHTVQAEGLLALVEKSNGGNIPVSDAIAAAQVHAILALAARFPTPVEFKIAEQP